MKTLLYTLLILAGTAAYAQTAKVVALTPEETRQAQTFVDRQKALDTEKTKFEELLKAKYTKDRVVTGLERDKDGNTKEYPDGHLPWTYELKTKEGWYYGFEYSEDFKYIVPKATGLITYNPFGQSCLTVGGANQNWITPITSTYN